MTKLGLPACALALLMSSCFAGASGTNSGSWVSDFTVRDVKGRYFNYTRHAGQLVVFFFWHSQFKGSVPALKNLERLHNRWHQRGLVVVGVNQDAPQTRAVAHQAIRRLKLPFTNVMDKEGKLSRRLAAERYTCHIVLVEKRRVLTSGSICWPNQFLKLGNLIEELMEVNAYGGPVKARADDDGADDDGDDAADDGRR